MPIEPISFLFVKTSSGQRVYVGDHWKNADNSSRYSYEEKEKMRDNLENTQAGQWAIRLSDDHGNIKADDFNNFVRTHFPDVKFNPVNDTIDVFTAMNSFTTYDLELKTMQKADQRRQLENSGEKPSPEI